MEFCGYIPGAIGAIVQLHARYYNRHWNFDSRFEAEVATELAAFINSFDPNRDGFWIAKKGDYILASIAIHRDLDAPCAARLRWFIVEEKLQGQGIGKKLMQKAMNFCETAGFSRVYLHTFSGLESARGLYESFGFVLTDQSADKAWGPEVLHQTFEKQLGQQTNEPS